jgi:hypothetical protein
MDQSRIKRRRGPHPARGPAVAHMCSKASEILTAVGYNAVYAVEDLTDVSEEHLASIFKLEY